MIGRIRLAAGARIVLATHNAGKAREIADLLAPFSLAVEAAGALGLDEPEETAETFEGNARLKALAAARAASLPALADDSGLEVASLGGKPGVRSARWAGPERDFGAAMRTVRQRLEDAPQPWKARFVCVLAVALPDGCCGLLCRECAGRAGLAASRRQRVWLRSDVLSGRIPSHFRRDGPGGEGFDQPSGPARSSASCGARWHRHPEAPEHGARYLCPLAILPLALPVLRFQCPCLARHRPASLAGCAALGA